MARHICLKHPYVWHLEWKIQLNFFLHLQEQNQHGLDQLTSTRGPRTWKFLMTSYLYHLNSSLGKVKSGTEGKSRSSLTQLFYLWISYCWVTSFYQLLQGFIETQNVYCYFDKNSTCTLVLDVLKFFTNFSIVCFFLFLNMIAYVMVYHEIDEFSIYRAPLWK